MGTDGMKNKGLCDRIVRTWCSWQMLFKNTLHNNGERLKCSSSLQHFQHSDNLTWDIKQQYQSIRSNAFKSFCLQPSTCPTISHVKWWLYGSTFQSVISLSFNFAFMNFKQPTTNFSPPHFCPDCCRRRFCPLSSFCRITSIFLPGILKVIDVYAAQYLKQFSTGCNWKKRSDGRIKMNDTSRRD